MPPRSRLPSLALVAATSVLEPRQAAGPELVERGTISTPAPEFAYTATPDGSQIFFNRATPSRDSLWILTTRRVDGRLTPPTVAPFSGQYRDVDPFITPDGSRLYFSSNRPRRGEAGHSFNTWYVDRVRDGWGDPIALAAPANTDSVEIFVSAARDGTLAFTSNRSGSNRVYLARPGSEPEAVTMGSTVDVGNPALAPDGRYMIVVKTGPNGADLYLTCRTAAGWSEPTPLPRVNSTYADFAPNIDSAGEYLYFTSERPGVADSVPQGTRPPGDIYRIRVGSLVSSCR